MQISPDLIALINTQGTSFTKTDSGAHKAIRDVVLFQKTDSGAIEELGGKYLLYKPSNRKKKEGELGNLLKAQNKDFIREGKFLLDLAQVPHILPLKA